jgi:hypothetical protein
MTLEIPKHFYFYTTKQGVGKNRQRSGLAATDLKRAYLLAQIGWPP